MMMYDRNEVIERIAKKHVTPAIRTKDSLHIVHATITAEAVDLDGEVILLSGLDTSYFPTQVNAVYLDHQYTSPFGVAAIGKCRTFAPRGKSIVTDTHIADTARGRDVWEAIKQGLIGHTSVGFAIVEAGDPTADEAALYGSSLRRVVRKAKLLEYSFVSMPANTEARVHTTDSGADEPERRTLYVPPPRTLVVGS